MDLETREHARGTFKNSLDMDRISLDRIGLDD